MVEELLFLSQSLLALACFLEISLIDGPSIFPSKHHLQEAFMCMCMDNGVEWERGRIYRILREMGACKQFISGITTLLNSRVYCLHCVLCKRCLLEFVMPLSCLQLHAAQSTFSKCSMLPSLQLHCSALLTEGREGGGNWKRGEQSCQCF